jgi:hypothetical protein
VQDLVHGRDALTTVRIAVPAAGNLFARDVETVVTAPTLWWIVPDNTSEGVPMSHFGKIGETSIL